MAMKMMLSLFFGGRRTIKRVLMDIEGRAVYRISVRIFRHMGIHPR